MTHKFGEIEVPEDMIITLNDGMLGFHDYKRFVILQQPETAPFCLLQSVEEPMLGFTLLDPFLFMPDYKVDLSDAVERMSWRKDNEELSLFVVVTIPQNNTRKMSANMIGPVVINNRTKDGIQLVLQNSRYSHKHPIFTEAE